MNEALEMPQLVIFSLSVLLTYPSNFYECTKNKYYQIALATKLLLWEEDLKFTILSISVISEETDLLSKAIKKGNYILYQSCAIYQIGVVSAISLCAVLKLQMSAWTQYLAVNPISSLKL